MINYKTIKTHLINLVPNQIRLKNESKYYSDNIFKINRYINHSLLGNSGDSVTHIREGRCHIFLMGTQDNMIKDGWLRQSFTNEYRDESILVDWLEENIIGFYIIRRWGNGLVNHGQSYYGLWHVEVHIMRDEDAAAFKLKWW